MEQEVYGSYAAYFTVKAISNCLGVSVTSLTIGQCLCRCTLGQVIPASSLWLKASITIRIHPAVE